MMERWCEYQISWFPFDIEFFLFIYVFVCLLSIAYFIALKLLCQYVWSAIFFNALINFTCCTQYVDKILRLLATIFIISFVNLCIGCDIWYQIHLFSRIFKDFSQWSYECIWQDCIIRRKKKHHQDIDLQRSNFNIN